MRRLFFLLFGIVLLHSCDSKRSNNEILKEKVLSWYGKHIYLPQNLEIKISQNDTICPELFTSQYKILVYVDSTGCTPCKLRLFDWREMIREVLKINKNVSFLFYVNIKDYKIVEQNIKMNNFFYPIILDKKDKINQINHLSNNPQLHTFLLDRNNKVLLVGNPIENLKLRELYIQQISK